MTDPTQDEAHAAQRAAELEQARQYARATQVLQEQRAQGDSAYLRRQAALCIGGGVEYRMRLCEVLGICPPQDVLERLLSELDDALALDDTIDYLHWDRAVLHSRFTGDVAAAREALKRATALGLAHPMLGALHQRLDTNAPPLPLDTHAAARLRELFFRLVDRTADWTIEERSALPAPPDSLPVSFADYVEQAEIIVRTAPPAEDADVAALYQRWRQLVASGAITADPLDYGNELMFRAAAATGDTDLARPALEDLARYLRDFSFHVSGGTPDEAALRKARRIARRALDIVAGTGVPLDTDLHADLWLALGQSAARPSDLRLADALDGYTRALTLKREAGNDDDVERLTALLQQMLAYAVQQAVAAVVGFGALGEARADMEAAYGASKIIGDRDALRATGLHYQSLLSSLAQPWAAIDVLDELLAQSAPGDVERFELEFEKAMRLGEARKPADALSLQESLRAALDAQSPRTRCMYWNAYSNCLRELERYTDALEALDRSMACRSHPKDGSADDLGPMLHTNRGFILLNLGRVEDAEREADQASEMAAAFPAGDTAIRIGELRTLLALARSDYQWALEESDRAIERLQERITHGRTDPTVWQSMLQEWSRFDTFGLEARIRSGKPAAASLAFAEAAKGRILRLMRIASMGGDPRLALTPEALKTAIERVTAWAKASGGRCLVALFCSSRGIAVFCITGDGQVGVTWQEGPAYDTFRNSCYNPWEDLSAWALDRNLQQAAGALGAPPELVLHSAEAMSELLLDKMGSLLESAVPELAAGGSELVIVPHRALRSLPLPHAVLRNGKHLSEVFDQVTTVPTLDAFARFLESEPSDAARLDAFADPRGDLPFARLEGAVGYSQRPRTGWQATRRELLRALETPGRLLVSTHGDFDEDDPFRSWLEVNDGRVYLADLVGQITAARSLVILSSCEVGRSQRSNSDEPFGFPAMLHEAGIAQVIAPCWQVDELPTFLLMTRFQEHLSEGYTPPRALNLACHWLRTLNASDTLARLDALEQRVLAHAPTREITSALTSLGEQRAWLESRFGGPELPFAAPLFWAGFQISGAPSL